MILTDESDKTVSESPKSSDSAKPETPKSKKEKEPIIINGADRDQLISVLTKISNRLDEVQDKCEKLEKMNMTYIMKNDQLSYENQ